MDVRSDVTSAMMDNFMILFTVLVKRFRETGTEQYTLPECHSAMVSRKRQALYPVGGHRITDFFPHT